MKEHYKSPQEEMIDAYGEDVSAVSPQENEGVFEAQPRDQVLEGVAPDRELVAEQFFEGFSSKERAVAEQVVECIEGTIEKLNSVSALERAHATESLLGTAFAAAPTSAREQEQPPLWKRLATGATLGAKSAVKAVALTATMAMPGAAQEYTHPHPEITKKVDYLFGTSIFERLGSQRASFKREYTELETRKKEIRQRINLLEDARPQNTAEAAHVQRVEADRDAKLAALNVERTLETMAFDKLPAKTPADKAQYDAAIAEIAAREARAIEECEAQLLVEHRKVVSPKELDDLHREILRIERKENELVSRFRGMQRSSYGSGWTQWDGYK